MSVFDRAVSAAAYNDKESIRASNGWYQSFMQDIEDAKNYPPPSMPVSGTGSYIRSQYMKIGLPHVATNVTVTGTSDSGHYLFEEQPGQVPEAVLPFLAS